MDATPDDAPTDATPPSEYRARLVRLYEKYSPEKVAKVDWLLEKYKSQPEELLRRVSRGNDLWYRNQAENQIAIS